MIRLSTNNDIKGIIALWNEAFGDCEEDILFFLNRKYIPENTVVFEDDGKIASVLFLLEGDMHIKGKDYPSYYLYAAATLKSYRGKGIMKQMLEYSGNIASGRGVEFICLRPGNKSLFEFYEKYGYKTVFYSKKLSVTADQLIQNDELSDGTPLNLAETRDKFLENCDYFKWSEESIRFALDHNSYFGGTNILTRNGCSLYTHNGDVLYVKETTLTDARIPCVSTDKLKGKALYNVVFNLPVSVGTEVGECIIESDGMAISCGETDVDIIENGYLGLTLE